MKRRLWELGKDILILLLVCSLLLLAAAALPAETIRQNHLLSRLLQPFAPVLGLPQAELAYVETAAPVMDAAQPVMISVQNSAGRGTAIWDFDALDAAFETFGGLLGQALDTAEDVAPVDDARVQTALSGRSVCFRYSCTLPAALLASWLDAGTELEAPDCHSCVLSLEDGGVALYLLGDGAFRASTALQPEQLEPLLEQFRPDGSLFAYEAGLNLEPLTLIPGGTLTVPAGTASSPVRSRYVDDLATSLDFNPYGETRYTDSQGVVHFSEANCALEISPDGSILLTSSAENRFTAPGAEANVLTETARQLVELTLDGGVSRLYLSGFSSRDGETVCTFDYYVSGIPVAMPGGYGARVTFSGRSVTRMEVCAAVFRLAEGELYPLPAAQAVAVLPRNGALTLQYRITADQTLDAGWKK